MSEKNCFSIDLQQIYLTLDTINQILTSIEHIRDELSPESKDFQEINRLIKKINDQIEINDSKNYFAIVDHFFSH